MNINGERLQLIGYCFNEIDKSIQNIIVLIFFKIKSGIDEDS
jgi:hypothetical protein